MRFLLIAHSYSRDGRSPWLHEELAVALTKHGHTVDVIVKDMKDARPPGQQPKRTGALSLYSVGIASPVTSRVRRRLRLPATMVRLRFQGARWASRSRYDAVLYSSIAFTSAGLPGWLRRKGVARKVVLIYWDFFPIHQKEIGHLGKFASVLVGPLRALEARAVGQADIVFTMSPKNANFFRRYFPSSRAVVLQTPPWGSLMPDAPTWDTPRPPGPFTVVFGGQLTSGRGVEILAEVAALLDKQDQGSRLLIYGEGPLRARLEGDIERLGLSNLKLMGSVPREKYQQALSEAHIGLALTVPDVSVPTYPSKIIDYCRAGLPVIVAVEKAGDAGEPLVAAGAGWRIAAGRPRALADAIQEAHRCWAAGEWPAMSSASRTYFLNELVVDVTVRRIVQAVSDLEGASITGLRRDK